MTRTHVKLLGSLACVLLVGASATAAQALGGPGPSPTFEASLTSYQEVPALSTAGEGTFQARQTGPQEISYRLTYTGLTDGAIMAHLHLGQAGVNGSVSVTLCSATNPDGTVCPDAGTVEGTITPASVTGPVAQGIAPGEFDELVRAIKAGVVYVNVHSRTYSSGEIRGQLQQVRPRP